MARSTPMVGAAACVVVACSSGTTSGNGSGSNAFPFSGPSCPSGGQPSPSGQQTNAPCAECVQARCSTQAQCASSACSDYYTCFCACAQGNGACYAGCQPKLTASCSSCIDTITRCESQNCGAECGFGSTDGGALAPAPDASGATGVCAHLATCCAAIGESTARSACMQVASSGIQPACQGVLPAFQDAGTCP
jgi:hypothetical protein